MMTKRPPWNPRATFLAVCLGVTASHPSRADEAQSATTDSPGAVPIEGVVTYDGPLPRPIPVAEAATVRPLVEVDPTTRGLKDAVVWLDGTPVGPGPAARKPPVAVDQRNFFFLPH